MVKSIGTSLVMIGFTLTLGLSAIAQKRQKTIDDYFRSRNGPKIQVDFKPKKAAVVKRQPPLSKEEEKLRYILALNGVASKKRPLTDFERAYLTKVN